MVKESAQEISEADMAVFKKKLRNLAKFKGKGTELISLYLPPDVDRGTVMGQLTEETSQSSNIKSPTTRKNVQGALRRVQNFLKTINFKLPKNGLVVFCGNVSEKEGKSDIQLFTVKPIKRLNVKLYWCDSEFHLGPLREMAQPSEVFGLLTIDKNEATIAVLIGKKYEVLGHFTSGVAGKTRAGGQCLMGDSLVQLSDGNIVRIEAVGNPSSVKSVDFGDYSIQDSFILNKWTANKFNALKIITRHPRLTIACSKDHQFFCWDHGKIEEKAAEELKENDFLIMPERVHVTTRVQKLDSNCFNSYSVSKKGLKAIIETRKKLGLSQKEFGKTIGVHQASVSRFELGKFNPRVCYLKRICNGLSIDMDGFISEFCKPKSILSLPSELGKDFAQIIGYLLGDGNMEDERLSFYEGEKETALFYEKLLKKAFNAKTRVRFRADKNYYELRCQGKPIVRMITQEFPEASKARDSTIPRKILKSDNRILAAFLRGLFDAEGYVTKRRLSAGMNNETLVKQIQMSLLRFGILSSVHEYDNKRNPYSNNRRFTLDIAEGQSLKAFEAHIGFSFRRKLGKLKELANSKKNRSCVRPVFVSGKEIRRVFESHGLNTQAFPAVSDFFRNQKMMGKDTFQKSIIEKIKDKRLAKKFKAIANIPLLPIKIHKIEKINLPTKMYDITVKTPNFISNGLIAHNSAHRFERLREEAAQDFYKRISEKMNEMFLPYNDKLKGLIVSGPGITKNYFLNQELMDHRLKSKLIGTLDVSYTDESGIREMVQKSGEILKDAEITKERQDLERFFEAIVKTGLAAYGNKQVEEDLTIGKVDTLLVSEEIEWWVYKFKCTACNSEEEIVVKNPSKFEENDFKCSKCKSPNAELVEQVDYLDWIMEKANSTGARTKIISTETAEGEQFLNGFGGVGAILRYK